PKVLKIALKIKRGTQSKKHTLGFKGLHGIFSTFFSIPAQNRKKKELMLIPSLVMRLILEKKTLRLQVNKILK
ncbi:hypothetical protein, partial [Flavobacterium covae]|uniref:hypothetical protein n=1 Tax=Flavobacterium covae TaxID=2906076 RepID=UPI003390E82A